MGFRGVAKCPHAALLVQRSWIISLSQELVHQKCDVVVNAQNPLVQRVSRYQAHRLQTQMLFHLSITLDYFFIQKTEITIMLLHRHVEKISERTLDQEHTNISGNWPRLNCKEWPGIQSWVTCVSMCRGWPGNEVISFPSLKNHIPLIENYSKCHAICEKDHLFIITTCQKPSGSFFSQQMFAKLTLEAEFMQCIYVSTMNATRTDADKFFKTILSHINCQVKSHGDYTHCFNLYRVLRKCQ